MRKFKNGDVVILSKPADTSESPIWVPDMDKYDGAICTVSEYPYRFDSFRTYETGNYRFNDRWAELYTEPLEVDDNINFF